MAAPVFKNTLKKSELVGRAVVFLYRALRKQEAPDRVQWCDFLWGVVALGTIALLWRTLTYPRRVFWKSFVALAESSVHVEEPAEPSKFRVMAGKATRFVWAGVKRIVKIVWFLPWPLRRVCRMLGVAIVTFLEKCGEFIRKHNKGIAATFFGRCASRNDP